MRKPTGTRLEVCSKVTAMPVIVIGGDTPSGRAILNGLVASPGREVRAFVSDEQAAGELRAHAVKVALGDVSDESHIEAAATDCFSAILVVSAASDERERSFADSGAAVVAGWARAVAKVRRAIWVSADEPPQSRGPETSRVDPDDPNLVSRVLAIDDAPVG